MNIQSKSTQTTFRILSCFCLVLVLKIVAIVSQSWCVLTIDINKCLNCGRMIVTMGELIEETLDEFDGNTKDNIYLSLDIEKEIDYYNELETNEPNKANEMKTDRYEDGITLFNIESEIKTRVGLWKALFCSQDVRSCALVNVSNTDIFSSLPLLADVKEKILVARSLFLISIVISVLSTVSETMWALVSCSNTFVTLLIGNLCSALVSLTGIVTASLPLLNGTDSSDVITFHIPWSLLLMLLADYVTLTFVYNICDVKKTLCQDNPTLTFNEIQNRFRLKITYYDIKTSPSQRVQRFCNVEQTSPIKKAVHYV